MHSARLRTFAYSALFLSLFLVFVAATFLVSFHPAFAGSRTYSLILACMGFGSIIAVVVLSMYLLPSSPGSTNASAEDMDDPQSPPGVKVGTLRIRKKLGRSELIEGVDPGFSLPLFLDFARLVHKEATQAVFHKKWQHLGPFISPSLTNDLYRSYASVDQITHTVEGPTDVIHAKHRNGYTLIKVRFLSIHKQHNEFGNAKWVETQEEWGFRRVVGATSLSPELMEGLCCPKCGNPWDSQSTDEACAICYENVGGGRYQWQAVYATVQVIRGADRMFMPIGSGDQNSVSIDTIPDDGLGSQARRLQIRYPNFTWESLQRRADGAFVQLHQALSSGDPDLLESWATPALIEELQFDILRHSLAGLRAQYDQVTVDRSELVSIQSDAWLELITVRVWASMHRSLVVEGSQDVVGGDPDNISRISAYLTLAHPSGTELNSENWLLWRTRTPGLQVLN